MYNSLRIVILFNYHVIILSQSEMEQERFQADLSRCVNMQMAFKAQLKVFVSKGNQKNIKYSVYIYRSYIKHYNLPCIQSLVYFT